MHYTAVEYLYRDASNYKAWGGVLLVGQFSATLEARVKAVLESETFFVAERVGLPDLREKLLSWSNGRSKEDDHEWHELWKLREATQVDMSEFPVWGTVDEFTEAISGSMNGAA